MMTELSNLKKQLKIAQQKCLDFELDVLDDKKWNERFEQRQSLQDKFILSWSNYDKNKTKLKGDFFEISSEFAKNLKRDLEFRDKRLKLVEPYEQKCHELKKEIDQLEIKKWKQPHPKCPDCGSKDVAFIFWGMGTANQEDDEAVKQKEIVLGNNCKNIPDAKWNCTECGITWGEREE